MADAATVQKKPRVDARSAANSAALYFQDLYPEVSAFSLEEVELSPDGSHWLITLSFELSAKLLPASNLVLPFQPPRTKFKVFKVDAKTGAVLAMKIRKLE